MSCYGCACNFCLYNCELESYYFTPGEVKNVEDICFCCDECKWFDGDWLGKRSQWREECPRFHEPIKRTEIFQSTRPSRGATSDKRQFVIDRLFQSTRPARGATAKVNKFLCTFLQKRHGFQIFLRKTLPFKAFCRLQIGKNFSICGANRCGNFCELLLRTIRSSVLPEGRSACSQNAQFYSHTFSRDNRNADCLFPDP